MTKLKTNKYCIFVLSVNLFVSSVLSQLNLDSPG